MASAYMNHQATHSPIIKWLKMDFKPDKELERRGDIKLLSEIIVDYRLSSYLTFRKGSNYG